MFELKIHLTLFYSVRRVKKRFHIIFHNISIYQEIFIVMIVDKTKNSDNGLTTVGK